MYSGDFLVTERRRRRYNKLSSWTVGFSQFGRSQLGSTWKCWIQRRGDGLEMGQQKHSQIRWRPRQHYTSWSQRWCCYCASLNHVFDEQRFVSKRDPPERLRSEFVGQREARCCPYSTLVGSRRIKRRSRLQALDATLRRRSFRASRQDSRCR
jgi:hypothetical protein